MVLHTFLCNLRPGAGWANCESYTFSEKNSAVFRHFFFLNFVRNGEIWKLKQKVFHPYHRKSSLLLIPFFMEIGYSVKNFRVFGEQGARLSIRPITILTGCNSSGKSSLVKSMLLLRNFFLQGEKDKRLNGRFCPQDYSLDFSLSGLKLGSFETSHNRNSPTDSPIEISYVSSVKGAMQQFKVSLCFSQRVEDEPNKGYLDSITISTEESGEEIMKLSVRDDGFHMDRLDFNSQVLLGFLRFCAYSKHSVIYKSSCL